MSTVLANPVLRRLITIPVTLLMFGIVTLLLPLLLPAALAVDLYRFATSRVPFVGIRGVSFLWLYLLGEVFALVSILLTIPLPKPAKLRATTALQSTWAGWLLRCVRFLFDLDLVVSGAEAATPGPIVVLSRHASLIDTLLPSQLITDQHGIRLRYVLKKELVIDPALDLAGHRLPNAFIDRSQRSDAAIRELAGDLSHGEGLLIYPEGTRFSEAKRQKYTESAARKSGPVGELAAGFRNVLPPRPGGTLTLLDSTDCDVVILAHSGLELLSNVKDIWSGRLVGTAIRVEMWRISRSDIPTERAERVRWLFEEWAAIDRWIEANRPA